MSYIPEGWTAQEVEAELDGIEQIDYSQPVEQIQGVQGQSRAVWHQRKVNFYREQLARTDNLYRVEIERIEGLHAISRGRIQDSIGWHTEAIESWHRRMHADGLVPKRVDLIHGVSSLKASKPPTRVIADEELLFAHLEAKGVSEKVWPVKPPVLSKSELNKVVKPQTKKGEPGEKVAGVDPDGEKVPGVFFVLAEDGHYLGEK